MPDLNDFTVHQYGTDVSGRPVYQTAYYHAWEQARWNNLGFSLPILQGGFMTRLGGGARASSGAHDEAGSCDYKIDHLTPAQSEAVVHEFRSHGGAFYRRGPDPKHGGMGVHGHNTLGADQPLSPMAATVFNSYVAGGDGLAAGDGRPGDAPDYEWRPSPLVTTPPPEDDMPNYRDWAPEDKRALASDVADEVVLKLRRMQLGKVGSFGGVLQAIFRNTNKGA